MKTKFIKSLKEECEKVTNKYLKYSELQVKVDQIIHKQTDALAAIYFEKEYPLVSAYKDAASNLYGASKRILTTIENTPDETDDDFIFLWERANACKKVISDTMDMLEKGIEQMNNIINTTIKK